MLSIVLYKNKAETNRVDKTGYLTEVGILNGTLRDDSSLVTPVINIEMLDIPIFNYVYIPELNRYYFVSDITSLRYKLWEISLSVDVLMTYKEAILSCVGFIDRNEYEFNSNIIDNKRAVAQGRTIEVATIRNQLFDFTKDGSYVLEGLLVQSVE